MSYELSDDEREQTRDDWKRRHEPEPYEWCAACRQPVTVCEPDTCDRLIADVAEAVS